jgi:hypothetical protein
VIGILSSFVVAGLLFISITADAYTGRRAVLKARGELMLAENLPHKTQDCSLAAWRMLTDVFPELKITKWFHRTTAEAIGAWPWPALMSLDDAMFGDLLFANSNDDNPALRPPKEQFRIRHVMMHWDRPRRAVHAGKKRGFSETDLDPFWTPRINLAIRPPY